MTVVHIASALLFTNLRACHVRGGGVPLRSVYKPMSTQLEMAVFDDRLRL